MKNITKEKNCAFYASDYHFEMISLPYISKSLDEKKKVIVLTENDLSATVKNLVDRMNLNEVKKKEILNINWSTNDLIKFKEVSKQKEEMIILVRSRSRITAIIFIKGKKNYIENVNKNINKWIEKNDKVKIIDCYEFFEVEDSIDEIAKKYNHIIGTPKEQKIVL